MSGTGQLEPRRPRVGLWGVFDVDDAGQVGARAGVEAELRAHPAGVEVVVRAPLGDLHPLALDGGSPALPLAGADPARLAAEADCVVISGGELGAGPDRLGLLYGAAERGRAEPAMARLLAGPDGVPVAMVGVAAAGRPAAAVAVAAGPLPATALDPATAADLGGPAGPVGLVAHPALLLAAHLDPALQHRRRRFLAEIGWLPADRPALLIQGDAGRLDEVGAVAAAARAAVAAGAAVVVVEGGSLAGEGRFADALAAALDGDCRRLRGVASLEDLAAAVGAASACLTSRPGVAALAAGLGVPLLGHGDDPVLAATLGAVGAPAPVAAPALGAALAEALARRTPPAGAAEARDRLAAALAGVVGLAAGEARTGGDPARGGSGGEAAPSATVERADAIERSLRARGRRLLADRAAYLERLAEREEEIGGLRAELEVLRAELERTRATLATVLGSRTWRLTEPVRELAERLRRGRR